MLKYPKLNYNNYFKLFIAVNCTIIYLIVQIDFNFSHLEKICFHELLTQKNIFYKSLISYIVYIFCKEMLFFTKSIISNTLETYIHCYGFNYFFKKILDLKYSVFCNNTLDGIQTKIFSQTNSLIVLTKEISIDIVYNILYVFYLIRYISSQLSYNEKLKFGGLLIMYFLISFLIYKKKYELKNCIKKTKNFSKICEILMNYERIIAYDNIEVELATCFETENYQLYDYFTNYFTNYFINDFLLLLNQIFLLFINCILLRVYNNKTNFVNNISVFFIAIDQFKKIVDALVCQFDKIYKLYLNIREDKPEEYDRKEYGIPISSFRNSIIIENLSFCVNKNYVLKSLNCKIKKGEKILIAGENGTGKSIFIKILCGLLEYNGSIKIDNIELKDINKKSLYGIFGNISKNTVLSVSKYLKHFKNKFDFEKKNKIVFYHNNILDYKDVDIYNKNILYDLNFIIETKSILVIDKLCSELDKFLKIQLDNYIKKDVEKKKTIIKIADNVSDFKNYDKIFFFKKNENVEIGTFYELMKNKEGFYNYIKYFVDNKLKIN